jgi:hypothetical protein
MRKAEEAERIRHEAEEMAEAAKKEQEEREGEIILRSEYIYFIMFNFDDRT